MKYRSTPIVIDRQGAPICPDVAYIMHGNKKSGIVGLVVPMRSKRCAVCCEYGDSTGPGIGIEATEDSLHLGKETGDTYIKFPMFKGWNVFAESVGRYDINVCLVKEI